MRSVPKLLLVDDDPAVRASLSFSLELEGFKVEAWPSGEAAMEASAGGADCLILDYRLPGMDGLELLERLRAEGVEAPALLITSAPTRKLRRKAAEAGAELIEKPLMCDALTAAIRPLARGFADALPEGLEPYRQTPEFTEKTVPAGLLRSHSTKEGVWGLIRVSEGALRYRLTDPRRARLEREVRAGGEAIAEPEILHEVEPVGRVRFAVAFYKAEEKRAAA